MVVTLFLRIAGFLVDGGVGSHEKSGGLNDKWRISLGLEIKLRYYFAFFLLTLELLIISCTSENICS